MNPRYPGSKGSLSRPLFIHGLDRPPPQHLPFSFHLPQAHMVPITHILSRPSSP